MLAALVLCALAAWLFWRIAAWSADVAIRLTLTVIVLLALIGAIIVII